MTDTAVTVASRPRKPRPHLTSYLLVIALVAFTVFAAREIGLKWSSFVDMWTNPLWERFWPVPWEWVFNRHNVFDPLIETFQIAIISTIIGCSLALPIGFAMSKLTTPNAPTFWFARIVMNIMRAVPDLPLGNQHHDRRRAGDGAVSDTARERETLQLGDCVVKHHELVSTPVPCRPNQLVEGGLAVFNCRCPHGPGIEKMVEASLRRVVIEHQHSDAFEFCGRRRHARRRARAARAFTVVGRPRPGGGRGDGRSRAEAQHRAGGF